MKRSKLTLVLALLALTAVFLNHAPKKNDRTGIFALTEALAYRDLNPNNIGFVTAAGRGDFARFLYFLVNGAPAGYNVQGPPGGFVGMINHTTNKIGRALQEQGYADCASVPTTGSVTKSIVRDGVTLSLTMAFSTGTKTIPTGYQNSGATFEKRIVVTAASSKVMAFEMTCDATGTVKTGYINNLHTFMKESGRDVNRGMEIYFQKNESTNEGHVDLLQVATGTDSNNEHLAVRFNTTDGDLYKLWVIRTTGGVSDSFGLFGKRSANLLRLHAIHETGGSTNTDAISPLVPGISGSVAKFTECLDFSGADAVTTLLSTCTSAGVNSSIGSFDASFGGSPISAWNIQSVAAASVSTPI